MSAVGHAFASQETAADRFKAARENEQRTRKIMDDTELDWRIAVRSGDDEATALASAAHVAARTEWYGYYQACKDSAKSVVCELGVEPHIFKFYL